MIMRISKKIVLLLISVLLLFVTACTKAPDSGSTEGSKNTGASSTPQENSPGKNQGITVNKIKFEEVKEEDIPAGLKIKIESHKEKRGYLYEAKDGYHYVAVLMGTKATGGYSVKVRYVEDNEGKTLIEVEETSPKQGDMVTQAITYPMTVVRMKGITDNFNIKNTKGESFSQLK